MSGVKMHNHHFLFIVNQRKYELVERHRIALFFEVLFDAQRKNQVADKLQTIILTFKIQV